VGLSLSAFRRKVVILAFTDSECTTVCPLTTMSMVEAKQLLGHAGQNVQLLGIDANPDATAVSDVMSYSRSHAMVNQWDFLTGSLDQLHAVWKAYHIYVQIQSGQVDHTPALFVINQRGQEEEVYLTTMAYASVGQEAQILANGVATPRTRGAAGCPRSPPSTRPSSSRGSPRCGTTWPVSASRCSTRLGSMRRAGSPTATVCRTSHGSCWSRPPARSSGAMTAGSRSPR